ncbi:MAG TPA: hypothetical protein VH157_13900, partial [Bryobacteraceae bacterium]|nr:hypothetical protein [Bryobacteraceae bacterium]
MAFEELQTGLPVCDAWLEIAGGQMWSLLTTNQQGIATRTELRPTMVDGDYVVGFTWTRERAARVTKKFHNGIWAAFAIEDPETTYSAAFVPSNIDCARLPNKTINVMQQILAAIMPVSFV